jgi:hypothetical protein
MNERIHQQIAESAAHVRELDERDKELSSEIEERQAEKARVALERD